MLGLDYERILKDDINESGAADLSAHFLRRCTYLSRGFIGLVTTDRISSGATERFGLGHALGRSWTITRAVRKMTWPGEAQTEISLLWLAKYWSGLVVLDGESVSEVSSNLRVDLRGEPAPSRGFSVVVSLGFYVYGEGFVLSNDERRTFLESGDSASYIRPYMSAADFASDPRIRARRWVIDLNEFDSEEEAQEAAPDLMDHLGRTVKPVRDSLTGQIHEDRYWRYWDLRPALHAELKPGRSVIAWPRLSAYTSFAVLDANQVFADSMIVMVCDDFEILGVLLSGVHQIWKLRYQNDRGTRSGYVIDRCFGTFPVDWDKPIGNSKLSSLTSDYASLRTRWMIDNDAGLTKFYAWFHRPSSEEVWENARHLRQSVDIEVLGSLGISADGWHLSPETTRVGQRLLPPTHVQLRVLQDLLDLANE